MTAFRLVAIVLTGWLCDATFAAAQPRPPVERLADGYLDPVDGLSLEGAIQQAIDREPSLRKAHADVDAARGLQVQAGLRPNPLVSVERRQEPGGTDTQTMASVEWPLEVGRRGPRIAVADQEVEAAKRGVEDRIRLLRSEVRAHYGSAAAALATLQLADRAVDLVSRQFELARQRSEEGAAPPLERDQIEVERQRVEVERLLAAGRLDSALIELRRAMGLPADAPLWLKDALDGLVETMRRMPSSVPGTAAVDRADIQAASAQVTLAQTRIERARSEGQFDVGLFGSYARMDTGFPQYGFNTAGQLERVRGLFNYVAVGTMITIPIGNRNQGDIATARAEHVGAEAQLEAVKLAAQAEVHSAEAIATRASQALALTETTMALAAKNLDVVRQTFELGRGTLAELLTEQRRYLDFERVHLDTMKAVYDASVALLQARGER